MGIPRTVLGLTPSRGSSYARSCPAGSFITAVEGDVTGPADPLIVRMSMLCARPRQDGGYQFTGKVALTDRPTGGRATRPFRFDCGPDGYVSEFVSTFDARGSHGLRVACATARR